MSCHPFTFRRSPTSTILGQTSRQSIIGQKSQPKSSAKALFPFHSSPLHQYPSVIQMSSTISNTARSGNVLVLLDLYASGFASSTASPTIPMLTSRTMHALYAISLLVYTFNSLFNWIHVYVALQGFLTSFPLHFWFILLLVVSSVSGTMLILLLMV